MDVFVGPLLGQWPVLLEPWAVLVLGFLVFLYGMAMPKIAEIMWEVQFHGFIAYYEFKAWLFGYAPTVEEIP